MRQSPSKAEIRVLAELLRRKLKPPPKTDKVVIFGMRGNRFDKKLTVMDKDKMTAADLVNPMGNRRQFTLPDYLFMTEPIFPVYMDGPVHKRQGVMRRDERIHSNWQNCDIKPLRIPFVPQLSAGKVKQIADLIQEYVESKTAAPNPLFKVYHLKEGQRYYSLIQAKNEDEAKTKFHRIHGETIKILQVTRAGP